MKKRLLFLVVLIVASALSLAAQSLLDNPDYKKSVELKTQAAQAFDRGDYDKAAEFANQAKDFAARSDQYVAKMVAMYKANGAIRLAKSKISAVDQLGWNTKYPDPYGMATSALADAQKAFGAEDYATAFDKATEASAAADALAKVDAEAAIAEAKTAQTTADNLDGKTNYPKEYADGVTALFEAAKSYDGGDYPSASTRARDATKDFGLIKMVEKPTPTPVVVEEVKIEWPAVYIVRLIPKRRDCLWRIAEYPFIYNNPLKWPVIYDANKKNFRDPGNPNLIFPGQKLQIPAIKGETREGTYDPAKTYTPLPKK
jgi:nucleoid-associated protein YgaU